MSRHVTHKESDPPVPNENEKAIVLKPWSPIIKIHTTPMPDDAGAFVHVAFLVTEQMRMQTQSSKI